jgi:anti-sigma regulatory factor (Ser/Thr protein kinase)
MSAAECPVGALHHRALLYGSDEQLRSGLLPYVDEGLCQGEHVVLMVSPVAEEVVRASLGRRADRLHWGAVTTDRERLGRMFERFRRYLAAQQDAEVSTRVVFEAHMEAKVPRLQQYLKYDALATSGYAPYGATMLCLWDRRRFSSDVLEQAATIHPTLQRPEEPVGNPDYQDVARYFSTAMVTAPPPPPPEVALDSVLVTLEELYGLREAVRGWTALLGVGRDYADDIVAAVSEIADNGIRHGRPPVWVRGWLAEDTVFFQVQDQGTTPMHPLAGYRRPPISTRGGSGLWLARQFADILTTHTDANGTTVRMYFPRWAA